MNSPITSRMRRARGAFAIAAGVALVPALFAVASATAGGAGSSQSPSSVTAGTELETEHGVVVSKPHGGAVTRSVSPSVSPTFLADVPAAAGPLPVAPTVAPEPGDDGGVDPEPDAEAGDDRGLDPQPVAEPGDDKGGATAPAAEPGDDKGGRSGRD